MGVRQHVGHRCPTFSGARGGGRLHRTEGSRWHVDHRLATSASPGITDGPTRRAPVQTDVRSARRFSRPQRGPASHVPPAPSSLELRPERLFSVVDHCADLCCVCECKDEVERSELRFFGAASRLEPLGSRTTLRDAVDDHGLEMQCSLVAASERAEPPRARSPAFRSRRRRRHARRRGSRRASRRRTRPHPPRRGAGRSRRGSRARSRSRMEREWIAGTARRRRRPQVSSSRATRDHSS